MRILVVDDKPDNTELLTQLLEDRYEVQSAQSGQQCLEIARNHPPGLIILDVMMPEMDGYEVLARLKDNPLTEHIPVVFLTAKYRDIDRVVKGLDLGAIDYLTKPIAEEELIARVNVAIRIKEAEDRILQQNAELNALNDELRALGYSVSHDLRAPLRHIDGMSRILLDDYGDSLDDEAKNYLQRILLANNRMKSSLEDLLNLSKVTATQFNREIVDVSSLVQEIVDDISQTNSCENVKINITPNLVANGDKNLLQLIFVNLIDNALKFSSTQQCPKIEIGMEHNNGRPIFSVTDNGVGFDENNSQRLFAPFQRLHDAEEFAGSGIGLAIVQRAVHRHGGTVWANSTPGQGSTFYFTLFPPIVTAAANQTIAG